MIQVWPDRTPGDYGDIGEEHCRSPWTARCADWLRYIGAVNPNAADNGAK